MNSPEENFLPCGSCQIRGEILLEPWGADIQGVRRNTSTSEGPGEPLLSCIKLKPYEHQYAPWAHAEVLLYTATNYPNLLGKHSVFAAGP